ncbi:MAG TPA: hypothetical protein VFD43_12345 [Planctomycetota bacterium]|nr:hypothetical protein [Planctomycetota bacterium]
MSRRRHRPRRLSPLVLACLLGALASRPSAQVELKIDSAVDGSTVLLQLGFELGEAGAVVLTPAAGTSVAVKELRVFADKHPLLPAAPTLDGIFKVWDNANTVGGVLAPGAPVYTSPLVELTPGGLNSWDVSGQGLVMDGPFVVGFQLVFSGQPSGLTNPTLVTDNDGCQAGLNWAQLGNGTWVSTCAVGFSGDLVIRALVQPLATGSFIDLGHGLAGGFAPTLTGSGSLAAGAGFSLVFAGMPPFTNGLLFVGLSVLNAPFKGGVLVPQPNLQIMLPTLSGSLVLNQAMPAGLPSGTSIYLHFWAPDGGAPVGVCATNALQLVTP